MERFTSGSITAANNLLAANFASTGTSTFASDVSGVLRSLGYNLIGNSQGGSGFSPTDLLNVDPLLGQLQDNGGPTQTMAVMPGSPALNAGDPTQLGTLDQRGVVRAGGVNIGAYQASASTFIFTGQTMSAVAGTPLGLTVTAVDPFGQTALGYNGTVHFRSSDDAATLPPDTTFGAADHGVRSFSFTLWRGGDQSITVTDTVASAIAGSVTINVIPVYVVSNTNDSGPGSLRQVLLTANLNPGLVTITFNIAGAGVQTITLASALPIINNPVVIDGLSQSGAGSAPGIELNGASAGADANGLVIVAGNSLVRGLVINRFSGNGIVLQTVGGNTLLDNYIGTDVTGTLALPNGGAGVWIMDSPNNLIGGTGPANGNLLSGNRGAGLLITGSAASGNVVQENFIGTDVTGTVALGNADGVVLDGTANNLVGGTLTLASNVISGNLGNGVVLNGPGATGNWIQGNFIGTDAVGIGALGNHQNGLAILGGANHNLIGGTEAGAANTIAFSGHDGILVDTGTGNAIRQNCIFASGNLGIELINGANWNQPAPVLTSATSDGSHLTIQGTFAGAANTLLVVEFFANTTASASGFGEGQIYLGSALVMTDDMGNATITAVFDTPVPPGYTVSATATDLSDTIRNGDTSQFSAWISVT
jgi:hypothetical protein